MLSTSVVCFILLITTTICIIVLTVYIAKLIISLTKLSENTNTIMLSIQKEIEPTLKELKEAAQSINSIALGADNQLKSTKAGLSAFVGAASCLGGKLKSFSQGILKGLSFGLGLFRK